MLQAHRLLLFSGSVEEIFYVFFPAPCMLMRWPETNNLAIIVLPNTAKKPANLVLRQGKIKLFLFF